MIKHVDKLLSETLVKSGLFSIHELEILIVQAQSAGEPLREYLIHQNKITEDQILKALSEQLHLDIIDVRAVEIDKKVLDKIPVRFAWYYKFMPLSIEQKTLTLAVFFPLEVKVQDEIRVHLGFEPRIVLAKEYDIIESLKKYYGLAADTIDRILTKESARKSTVLLDREAEVEDIEKLSEDASVTKLVNQIIFEAYQKRATDIHIEPYRNKVRFRYRIDGVLVDANLPPDIKHFLLPILSRMKIMANLSIVEKRLPQDGSAVVKTKDQTLDLRISTIPTPNGESMVIRILPAQMMLFSLERLGLGQDNVRIFRELIKQPHGIIFVTGPTGSGKTTTLYACLNEINAPTRKIITIEDPVEYELEGITQIHVNRKVNLDFAIGLRSILRHDPDVIMVGEVRDLETAEIAIRTALTGHLVFSTLHTNDASSGITRLIDMGIEPYLVASSIEAFVAQRLVRIICPRCKFEDTTPVEEIRKEITEALKLKSVKDVKIFKGKGCDHCNQTGFYGRTAIHEILVMSELIRAAVLEKPRSDYIKKVAMGQGMMTLRQAGWQKVFEGVTTPTEVMNVTAKENFSLESVDSEEKKAKTPSYPEETLRRLRMIPQETLEAKNEYESRVYKRVDETIEVSYKILYGEKEDPQTLTVRGIEHSTVAKNISAGGLVLVSNHSLFIGAILELKIRLKEGERSIDCLAKVCRVEEHSLTNMYNVIIYYLDISSANRVKIDNFVKDKLKTKGDNP